MGVSPRKENISVYLTGGLEAAGNDLTKLGKYKTGKACLYIRSMSDVQQSILKRILARSFRAAQQHGTQTG
jgi:hypothetical protein